LRPADPRRRSGGRLARVCGSCGAERHRANVTLALVPHFQLATTDGTVLGARELGRPDWPPGSVIYTGPDEPSLRVVDVVATEDGDDNPERFRVVVVEPA
jgi:hypothetical protein